MKPGRRPKPAELKLVTGNPGKRSLPKRDVKIPGCAAPPEMLKAEALKEWKRISPLLATLGLLKSIDREALGCYCQAVAEARWAVRRLAKDGRIVKAGNGTLIPHPAVQILRQAMDRVVKFSVEFGMTPAARAGIDITPGGGEDDEDDEFFGS